MTTVQTRDNPNPYLAARREWDERYGGQIAQIRQWRWAAFIALTVATVSSAGLVWTLSERRIVPYVVTVDKLGSAIAVGRADEAVQPDRAVTVAGLARFIADMRSVYVDAAAERAILKEGYAMINRRSDAYAAMNAHMRAHDPFERAKSETVTVEVRSVLPISAQTWRVERRKRDGTEPASTEMQATITLTFSAPSANAPAAVFWAGRQTDAQGAEGCCLRPRLGRKPRYAGPRRCRGHCLRVRFDLAHHCLRAALRLRSRTRAGRRPIAKDKMIAA
jgi:type IV secretion system protein TrbF